MKKNFRLVTTVTLAVILLSLLVIWIFGGASRLSAESAPTVLSMSIKQLTQDPKTLEIPVALSVYSMRDSDRVGITWELPRGVTVVGESSFFITVNTDEPTVIETRFKPSTAGRFDVKVKAEMFAAEVNYVASASHTLMVGNDLEALPVTDEYKKAKMEYDTKEFLKYAGIGLLVLTVVAIGGILFTKWLNAEDKK